MNQAQVAMLADPLALRWAGGLLMLHVSTHALATIVPSKLQAKPGVAAHQLVILIPFAYAAVMGTSLYLYDDTVAKFAAGSYADRLYGWSSQCWDLLRFMIGFQLYDLLATTLEPSLRKAEHLAHHGATLITAIYGSDAARPMCLYYCVFFFGIVEISSVPLVLVDLFRQLPTLAGSPLGATLNNQSRTLFAVSFLALRGVAFPALMVTSYWPDMIAAYRNDDIRCSYFAYGWGWFSSAFLTCLQLYWTAKIVRVIARGNRSGRDHTATAHIET